MEYLRCAGLLEKRCAEGTSAETERKKRGAHENANKDPSLFPILRGNTYHETGEMHDREREGEAGRTRTAANTLWKLIAIL